jgi:glycine/D-amino acid oxidase-like deaminating enzyme
LKRSIMPSRLPISDARRLLIYARFDAQGRFLIGARGSFGLHEPESYFRRLRGTAAKIFPQLRDARWEDSWGGNFALTLDHLPHIHNPTAGLYAAAGCNGRGVAMLSQIGRLIADLAAGNTAQTESPIPVTPIASIPFHPLRRPGLELATLWYRTSDKLGI